MSQPTAIDLFSGADGASLGLAAAGFDLRLAADFDPACGLTHAANLPGEFIVGDIRDVDADKVLTTAGVAPGELRRHPSTALAAERAAEDGGAESGGEG